MLTSSRELEIGQFVKSKAGRDKDSVLIVIGIFDDQHVMVVDGDLRKLNNPKKKKVKHLIKCGGVDEELQMKFETHAYINDAELRKKVSNIVGLVRVRRDSSNGKK
ncbi:KOW domain-containing RNA-binding protein [Fusibacter bizertensis]|jgi:LSU ribosomal protein L14E|uniref:KOW domain-containing RNA-binding protein n=1 Tax=Fusibacter bizertensis TaxID=1488331 RepID=A0ABT6NH97_9FIRM|nr:KOW domain-containing RNA-binding protein [Fusibacter bizertensis]MDH8679805.1 KOW domain-containing RNA-binding protein [Fusibacter bizertensis]